MLACARTFRPGPIGSQAGKICQLGHQAVDADRDGTARRAVPPDAGQDRRTLGWVAGRSPRPPNAHQGRRAAGRSPGPPGRWNPHQGRRTARQGRRRSREPPPARQAAAASERRRPCRSATGHPRRSTYCRLVSILWCASGIGASSIAGLPRKHCLEQQGRNAFD